jgi:hypothetical protein
MDLYTLIFVLVSHPPPPTGVEPHQIFADGWSVGYDDRFPNSQRLQQALLFARFSQHDNLYAHPLVPSFLYLYRTCIENGANRTLSR